MGAIYKYYKHSTSGEVIKEQSFISDTPINFPKRYYTFDPTKEGVEDFDLTGFVEISEKKYNQIKRKALRK